MSAYVGRSKILKDLKADDRLPTLTWPGCLDGLKEKEFFIDSLLIRVHHID